MENCTKTHIDECIKATEKALQEMWNVHDILINLEDTNKRYAVLKIQQNVSVELAKLSISLEKWKK